MAGEDATVAELRRFYTSYIETFNRGEAAPMAAFLAAPLVMVTGNRSIIFPDEAAGIALYEKILADLRGEGWASSSVATLDVQLAGSRAAILIVTAVRHAADGREMTRGQACYSMLREADGWKMAAIIVDFASGFSADPVD